jgi:hypothetical protein
MMRDRIDGFLDFVHCLVQVYIIYYVYCVYITDIGCPVIGITSFNWTQ